MNNFPAAVTKIANDYLERVRTQLRVVPAHEQEEFLRELQSHLYEAYQLMPGDDEVDRILRVLRRLGEPAEVVSGRLPGAMMRAGAKRNLPLYILGGVVLALFGIPLGFGGMGVLIGLLAALVGLVIAYYAVTGSMLLVGAIFAVSGLARIYEPALWNQLILLGVIHMEGRAGELFNELSPSGQGFILLVCASVFLAVSLGMLWLGKYLLRGMRFLFGMVFEWTRRLLQTVRGKLGAKSHKGGHVKQAGFVGTTSSAI